jgi:hypothetical protein
MTKQERLEEWYRSFLAQMGAISPEFRQRIYEDLRLQIEYPGEFVAYRDEWLEKGPGESPKLVRHVLAHCPDIGDILDIVRQQGRAEPHWLITLTEEEGDGRTVRL